MTTAAENDMRYGGCLCGSVRYRFSGVPLLAAVCHCRQCQRQGGSAFSVVLAVPAAAYEQTGTTRIFQDTGDSGRPVHRHFCGECGSPIVSIADALPEVTLIKAGTLDDPQAFRPTIEVYCTRALDWVPALPGATRFSGSNIDQES